MQLFEVNKLNSQKKRLLTDTYIEPPFSILNSITQRWQNRKREWLKIIGDSTEGRDVKRFNATPVNTFSARGVQVKQANSISEFDPVLAELMVRWFSNPNDHILDPFSGGSVRGIVSALLDRWYHGIDLSPMQCQANEYRWKDLELDLDIFPTWMEGDSEQVLRYMKDRYDMIFTCPPYYNLERYTNDPADLSNQKTYEEFINKFDAIMQRACRLLEDDRFVVIVISEIRHQRSGEMYGFVADTIKIMQNLGLYYYNEIILENNIGSLPIRAPKYFDDSRKIGRQHQNILVFYKGDMKHIRDRYPEFE